MSDGLRTADANPVVPQACEPFTPEFYAAQVATARATGEAHHIDEAEVIAFLAAREVPVRWHRGGSAAELIDLLQRTREDERLRRNEAPMSEIQEARNEASVVRRAYLHEKGRAEKAISYLRQNGSEWCSRKADRLEAEAYREPSCLRRPEGQSTTFGFYVTDEDRKDATDLLERVCFYCIGLVVPDNDRFVAEAAHMLGAVRSRRERADLCGNGASVTPSGMTIPGTDGPGSSSGQLPATPGPSMSSPNACVTPLTEDERDEIALTGRLRASPTPGPALDAKHPWGDVVVAAVRFADEPGEVHGDRLGDLTRAVRDMQHKAYGLVPPPAPGSGKACEEHPIHDWIPFSKRARHETIIEAARAVVRGLVPAVSAELEGSDWKHSRISDSLTDKLRSALADFDADWPKDGPFGTTQKGRPGQP